MNDEEKLKELFENKDSSKFEKVIKKAKLFSIIRTIITSILVFTIVGFMVLIFNGSTLNKLGNERIGELENYYKIAHPNSYIGTNQQDDRLMTGELDYVTYRFLGDKPIFDGNKKESYSYVPLINGVYGDNSGLLYEPGAESEQRAYEAKKYNTVGKIVMKFYNPSVKYDQYIDDLAMLNQIGKDKVMEISLSFNKSYSVDQVKNMISGNITLNWYWVDTYTEKNITKNIILYEDSVYGIKAIDDQGKIIDSPEKDFIDTISNGRKIKGEFKQLYENLFNKLSKNNVKITQDDIKILGVVVSGDKDSLMILKDKSFIKASSLGAVGDKY